MKEEFIESLKHALAEMRASTDTATSVRKYLDLMSEDLRDEIVQIDEQIADLRRRKDLLEMEILERDPESQEALSRANDALSECRARIKRAIHALPPEEVAAGETIVHENFRIRTSKVGCRISYKTEELLARFPDLRSRETDDGCRVVREEIDQSVMERLVAEGVVRKELLEPYIIRTKERNPSVRITALDE